MVTIRNRGEIAQIGDIIQLRAIFIGPDGYAVDLDAFPQISIQQPSGNVLFPFTSSGVYRVTTGTYGYDFSVTTNMNYGVWTDNWRGTYQSVSMYQTLNFVINFSQLPAMNSDGYYHLGDIPGFNFSQTAICNINKLIFLLRARLNSAGKHETKDEYGNVILEDCDIYTVSQLTAFLITGLTEFNGIPHFTNFTFEDNYFIDMWGTVLVQRAALDALASKALIERGREFDVSDNGVSFKPPGVSDLLSSQWNTELTNWWDKVKLIKQNLKMPGLGIGSYRTLGVSPQVMRMRHRRAGQYF